MHSSNNDGQIKRYNLEIWIPVSCKVPYTYYSKSLYTKTNVLSDDFEEFGNKTTSTLLFYLIISCGLKKTNITF